MDQPASAVRYEIQIDARDEDGNSSRFLHWAQSGRGETVERLAMEEFDRVRRAMRGEDVNIYADHFQTATLLKGDPPGISSTPNQIEVESYTRGA